MTEKSSERSSHPSWLIPTTLCVPATSGAAGSAKRTSRDVETIARLLSRVNTVSPLFGPMMDGVGFRGDAIRVELFAEVIRIKKTRRIDHHLSNQVR